MRWNEADRAKYDVIRAHYSSGLSDAMAAKPSRSRALRRG